MSSQVVNFEWKSKNFDFKKVTWIRASQIRVSQIRASQIRATEISSNHRELHGAIFSVAVSNEISRRTVIIAVPRNLITQTRWAIMWTMLATELAIHPVELKKQCFGKLRVRCPPSFCFVVKSQILHNVQPHCQPKFVSGCLEKFCQAP